MIQLQGETCSGQIIFLVFVYIPNQIIVRVYDIACGRHVRIYSIAMLLYLTLSLYD